MAVNGYRSFALIVDDPDAPSGVFIHWILFNIPGETNRLPPKVTDVGDNGRNDFQYDGYGGPCPPPNHGQHRYYFRLFALDVGKLQLQAGATRAELENSMHGHILGETEVMARYERTTG